jgi:hypothetical protein
MPVATFVGTVRLAHAMRLVSVHCSLPGYIAGWAMRIIAATFDRYS